MKHSYDTSIVLHEEDVSSEDAQKFKQIFDCSEVEVHLRVTADFYEGCSATELQPEEYPEAEIIEVDVENVVFWGLKLVMGDDSVQHYVGENVEGEVERISVTPEMRSEIGLVAVAHFERTWRKHEDEAWDSYSDWCNDTPD